MPYRTLKVHWIQYLNEEKVSDLYSYHSSPETFEFFRMRFLRENRTKQSPYQYSIGLTGWVLVSDTKGTAIKNSIFGIWHVDDMEVKQSV
ncbi:TPA: hypothetical protein DCG61_00510 [Patescibacteria group bacterium]|jgi:hypothetical protein|nr:hypothetical protein [Patescibacteria group bacterium]